VQQLPFKCKTPLEAPVLYCPITTQIRCFKMIGQHRSSASNWFDNTDQVFQRDWTTQIRCSKSIGQHKSGASKWLNNTDQVFQNALWSIWSVLSNHFDAPDMCCPIILKHLIYVVQSVWSTWSVLSNFLKHLICVVQSFCTLFLIFYWSCFCQCKLCYFVVLPSNW
jgi:hypothetical protein